MNNSSFDVYGDSTTRDRWRQSSSTVYRRVAFDNVHTAYGFTDKMMSTWKL
jgi:hypothetical protein